MEASNAYELEVRRRGQAAAVRANVFLNVVDQITLGGIMVLFVTDVLGFSVVEAGLMMTIQPLAAILRLFFIGWNGCFEVEFVIRGLTGGWEKYSDGGDED